MHTIGMYPGTFDPLTRGHEDIVRRALGVFDSIIIAVAASVPKQPLFSLETRIALVQTVFADEPRVRVVGYAGLTVECAREQAANAIIRGLRGTGDFESEAQMAVMNRELNDDIDTVFMVPAPAFGFISSSLIREIAEQGGDISRFVHPAVEASIGAVYASRH